MITMFTRLKNISCNYIMMLTVAIVSGLVLFGGLNMQHSTNSKYIRTSSETAYQVIDSQGFKFVIAQKPMRIVSLSVSTDEMLLALVGEKRLIGISPWSDVPTVSCIADSVKHIPFRAHSGNAEAVLAIQSDLIVVPDYTREEVVKTLREAGANVYVCKTPHKLKDVKDTILQLGKLVKEEAKADEIVAEMDSRLQKIAEQVAKVPQTKRLRVLRMQENGAYYAPDTSFRELCRLAGMKDAAEDLKYEYSCNLSQEEVVLLNPDVFVLEDWNYDGKHDAKLLQKQVLANKAYQATAAWKQQKAVLVPANHLLTVSQYMAAGVEDLAAAIYPEYIANVSR